MSSSDHPLGGRYELVRRIARGGGGTVWHARDTVLTRDVAVKAIEIPDELSDEERRRARTRVLQEARASARLDHPAAVVVHDVLDGDDRLHLVMELVEAPTLRELVQRDGPLPESMAAAIGLELVEVLEAAHERGIVHRDVKPSNIFVLPEGGVKLADFGIAALAGEASLTRTGTALGSPSYLAPEQAQGGAAAPPADLWGLGASLYYAVEGEPPFDRGNAIATVNAVVHEPPRPFQRATASAPVLEALLQKGVADRPSLADTRRRLVPLAAEEAPAAAPSPPPPATEPLEATAPAPAQGPAPVPATSPTPAADPRSDTAFTDEPSHGRRWPALLGAFAVVALLGLALLLTTGGEEGELTAEPPGAGPGPEASSDDDPATEPPADAGPEATPEESDQDGAGPEEGAGADENGAGERRTDEGGADEGAAGTSDTEIPEAEVPDDWQVVDGATYRVAIPPGWQERAADGNRTDFVDPETGAYLRVDWTDDPAPDPVADWEANEEGFAARVQGYERVRLEPATYRGQDAALWEYRYQDGGADLHALNLNLLAGERAYALNLQARVDDWEAVAELFPAIAGGFEPAG